MRSVDRTTAFKKAYKFMKKQGRNLDKLDRLIIALATTGTVPAKHRPHKLVGNHAGNGNATLNQIGYWYIRSMIIL